jgi:hypothetical protein
MVQCDEIFASAFTLGSLGWRTCTVQVQPHCLDVWLPAHDSDADVAKKLVSNNIKCYT